MHLNIKYLFFGDKFVPLPDTCKKKLSIWTDHMGWSFHPQTEKSISIEGIIAQFSNLAFVFNFISYCVIRIWLECDFFYWFSIQQAFSNVSCTRTLLTFLRWLMCVLSYAKYYLTCEVFWRIFKNHWP